MAVVHIPAALRPVASGATRAEVEGATLGEVIDALEFLYPGLRARLVEGERIRPGMAVFLDGAQAAPQLSTRVSPGGEIYFAPAVAGGAPECRRISRGNDRKYELPVPPATFAPPVGV